MREKLFVYPKNGNTYELIQQCKMKHPVERTWVDAVIYRALSDGKIYVREAKEFYARFKPKE